MRRVLIGLAFLVIGLLPITAKAAFFGAGDAQGVENITVDQSVSNAYLAGSTINVDGNVKKDLVAAGSTININGQVEDGLIIAGSTINLKNSVGGSARVAGSIINISNLIGGDLLVAGSDIIVTENAKIAGDLLLAAAKANIKGEISGNIRAVGGDITISGKVKGDVILRNVNKLVITDTAEITGKVTYYSPNQATIGGSAKVPGGVEYNKIEDQWNNWKSYTEKMTWSYTFYQILGSLILLLLLIYFMPKISKKIIDDFFVSCNANIGWGIVIFLLLPIASLILIALSFKITAVLMLVYALYLALASTFGSLIVGSWSWKKITKASDYEVTWQTVLLGVALTAIASFIPIIGHAVLFALTVITFGTMIRMTVTSLRK